ncbi:MAG: sigma-70 family RNA polymerase sigma factor [Planctomycetaceae bacterium]
MNDVSKPKESLPQQPDPSPAGEPANPGESHIAQLLRCVAAGRQASEAAYLALKPQLKAIAERMMKPADHLSLDASHVVNQVFVELAGNPEISWQDREHFLAYACKAIRSFLVDHARKRKTQKRGGGQAVADIAAIAEPVTESPTPDKEAELNEELLQLDEAMPALERDHPELAAVVYLHFFGGLSFERIAPLLDINPGTASRRWLKARTILQREMT